MADYNLTTNNYANTLLSVDSGILYTQGGLNLNGRMLNLNPASGANPKSSQHTNSRKATPIGSNVQALNLANKNPNRNKKVKDLILDLHQQQLQQQQQHQQNPQLNEPTHIQNQSHYQMMPDLPQLENQHLQDSSAHLIEQYQTTFGYFPKQNVQPNMSGQLNLVTNAGQTIDQQSTSNHLMELNLNSAANYLILDDAQSKLNSSSITLNCLNNTNNSNIDLIQLLNSTNTTMDDCNSLYNHAANKSLLDMSNNHSDMITGGYHLPSISHLHHHHHQQPVLSHQRMNVGADDEISSLSSTSSISSSHMNQIPGSSSSHVVVNGLGGQSGSHHHDLCADMVDVGICGGGESGNGQGNVGTNHQPGVTGTDDDSFLLYNIINKSSHPANSVISATDKIGSTSNSSASSSLLLLSASSEYLNPSSSSSPSSSSAPVVSNSATAPENKKTPDSSEYINLLINQAQSGMDHHESIKHPKQIIINNRLQEDIDNDFRSITIPADFGDPKTDQKGGMVIKNNSHGNATYATLQPAGQLASESESKLIMKQEKGNFIVKNEGGNSTRSDQYVVQNDSVGMMPILSSTPTKKSESKSKPELLMINTKCDDTYGGHDEYRQQQIASPTNAQMEELNTRELAHKISSELKRYSIPQAVFAQRVLCRSQGTLSDLLRNPKPWSKLKSGRETFRRMYKWLQEPESQRMNSLRLAAATKRKEDGDSSSFTNPDDQNDENTNENFDDEEDNEDEDDLMTSGEENQSTASPNPSRKSLSILNDSQFQHSSHSSTNGCSNAKKPRLVFTDIQRRTLQAIFKETKRPSKEMQVTIAQQLCLEVATVSNFFMNARRRSMDKWKDQDDDNSNSSSAK